MESEIRSLLDEGELSRVQSLRGAAERSDALNAMMRGVLSRSTLCHIEGRMMRYDGRGYVDTSVGEVRDAIVNVLCDLGVGASDVRRMGDTAMSVIRRSIREVDRSLVAFDDMLMNTDRGEVLPFDVDRVPWIELGYELNPVQSQRCDRWLAFLCEILPDEGVRMNLQEFFGMCLVDRTRISIEKMALFVGTGANGKSVVCDVMRAVYGGGRNVGNLSPDQLQDQKQVASLEGKILNIAPDVRKGSAFDSALKALASSQEVTGWKLYTGGVTIKCPPMCFALNEMPFFRDTTDAFFRRLLVFKFDVVISEQRQNRRLAGELIAAERRGIFRWALEGKKRLVANGGMFTDCQGMRDALEELKANVITEQSPILSHIADMGYTIVPGGRAPIAVNADDIVRGTGLSKHKMTALMKKMGVVVTRTRAGILYYLYESE